MVSSLVISAQPSYAFGSNGDTGGLGVTELPVIVDGGVSLAENAWQNGVPIVKQGASALADSDVRQELVGVATAAGTTGVGFVTTVGNTLANATVTIGGLIGLGHVPGLGALFGSTPASTLPAGTVTGDASQSTCSGYTVGGTTSNGFSISFAPNACTITGSGTTSGQPWTTYTAVGTVSGAPSCGSCRPSLLEINASGASQCFQSATTFVPSSGGVPVTFNWTIGYFSGLSGGATKVQFAPGPNGICSTSTAEFDTGSAPTTTNPNRNVETQATCTTSAGASTVTTVDGPTFQRQATDTSTVTSPGAPEVTCPAGSFVSGYSSSIVTPGAASVPVSSWSMNPDEKNLYTGGSWTCVTTKCSLHVVRLSPSLDCSSVAISDSHPCANWSTGSDYPANWSCQYGPTVVPMADCAALQSIYRSTGGSVGVNTGAGTTPLPVTTPNTFPTTGPNLDPSTGQQSTTQTGPSPDPADGSSSCLGGAWSWNPVDWVYIPVKCAMIWAFEPSSSSLAQFSNLGSSMGGKFPFDLASLPSSFYGGGVGAAALPVGGLGSCPDWHITVDGHTSAILCGTPFGDAIRGARPILAGLAVSAAVAPLIRSVWYAVFPVIKPHPVAGGR